MAAPKKSELRLYKKQRTALTVADFDRAFVNKADVPNHVHVKPYVRQFWEDAEFQRLISGVTKDDFVEGGAQEDDSEAFRMLREAARKQDPDGVVARLDLHEGARSMRVVLRQHGQGRYDNLVVLGEDDEAASAA